MQSFLDLISQLNLSDPQGFTLKSGKQSLTQYINNVFYDSGLGSPCKFKDPDRITGREFVSVLKYLGFDTAIDYRYGNIPKYPSLFLTIALLKPKMLEDLYSNLPSDFSKIVTYKDQNGISHKTYGSILKLAMKIEDQNKQIWQHGSIVSSSNNPIGSTDFYIWRIDRSLQENNGKLDDRKIRVARSPYAHNLGSPRLVKARAKFKVRSSELKAERHDPIYGFFRDPDLKGIIAIDTYLSHITTQVSLIYDPRYRSGIRGSIEVREVNAMKGSKTIKTVGSLSTSHDGKIQYLLTDEINLFCQGNLGILMPRLGIDPKIRTLKTVSNFSDDSALLDPLFWHKKDLEIAVLPNKTIRFTRGYKHSQNLIPRKNDRIETRSDRYRDPIVSARSPKYPT